EARLLGRGEPGHVRQREEPHVPAGDDKRVRYALEAADLHREVVEPLGLALFLRPGRAAAARDEMPELEIVARQVVGALVELDLVAALGQPAHRDLERSETSERGDEIGPKASKLFAHRIGARAAVASTASLGVDRQLAVALVEALPKALAADGGGSPDDRCTRGHLDGDYPAARMRDKTFSSCAWCEKMNEPGLIRDLLSSARTIAVFGYSARPDRPSNSVSRTLRAHGYRVIPVNPARRGPIGGGER